MKKNDILSNMKTLGHFDVLSISENKMCCWWQRIQAMASHSLIAFVGSLLLLLNSDALAENRYARLNGDWNATSTWSSTSGGVGGASIPTSSDSVFIGEATTYRTVTIPTGYSAACASLSLGNTTSNALGALILASSTSTLTVSGDVVIYGPTASNTRYLDVQAGTCTISGNLSLGTGQTSTSNLRICKVTITTGTITVNGNLTFNNVSGSDPAQTQIDMSGGAGTFNLGGSFTINNSCGTLTPGTTSTFNFNGTSAQTIPIGVSSVVYNNLNANNTNASGATLSAAISAANVTGNVSVQTGTLNNGGFAIVGNAAKTFSVSNSATFKLTGTSAMVTGFGTKTFNVTSTVNYAGSNQTVSGESYGNLTISGSGTKTLASNTTVAGTLTLTSSIIITSNTNLLTLGSSATVSGGSSSSFIDGPMAHTGTGNKTFPIGKGTSYRPATLGSITGTSPIIQAEVFNSSPEGTPGTGLTKISSVRYWQLNLNSGSFTSCTVNFTYGSDDGVTDAAYLRVAQSSTLTGTYTNRNGTGSANGSGNITSSSVSALGYFTLANATGGSNPVPVELVSFNAKVVNKVVLLDWRTATEVNNYGFEVERSSGSDSWDKIGFVNGHGNSNSPKKYYFEDSKLSNTSYKYRLKQVDNDGSFAYSNIVSVLIGQTPNSFALSQNYPNPFNPSTKISWQSPVSGWQTLKVYNILGNEVATLVNEFREAGSYEIDFNASQLTSGVYIYKISAGNFSDTKKMILSK